MERIALSFQDIRHYLRALRGSSNRASSVLAKCHTHKIRLWDPESQHSQIRWLRETSNHLIIYSVEALSASLPPTMSRDTHAVLHLTRDALAKLRCTDMFAPLSHPSIRHGSPQVLVYCSATELMLLLLLTFSHGNQRKLWAAFD